MSDSTDTIQQFDNPTIPKEIKEGDELRSVLADTYTFVRSVEINKTISSFTFDHYIDEAKRSIKEDRVLRSASDPNSGVGKRPSKLTALQKLETDFTNSLDRIRKIAKDKDSTTKGNS
jgi:hypothetical protein